jgi:hypothetical protein
LNARQRTAALALASGATQPEAGAAVDRSARTIRDWLRDVPGFRELANPRPPEVAAAADPEHGRHNVRAKLEQLSNHPRPEIQLGALRELAKLEPESSASGATYVSFLFTDDDTGDFNCPQCGHEFRPSSKSQLRESIDRNSAEHPDSAYMNFDELRAAAESNLSREVTPQVDGLPN